MRTRGVVTTLMLVGCVGAGVVACGPGRSEQAFCDVYRTERTRLLDAADPTVGAKELKDVWGNLSKLNGFTEKSAEFFARLEEVAPSEIQPDMATLRDIYRESAAKQATRTTRHGIEGIGDIGKQIVDSIDGLARTSAPLRRFGEYADTHCRAEKK